MIRASPRRNEEDSLQICMKVWRHQEDDFKIFLGEILAALP
jgi:hypothetical protein